MTTPIDMSAAKFSVMLRPRHADPRLRYVRNDATHPNITVTSPEDDNLLIHEVFPFFCLNLGYDFARSLSKARCAVKCIRRRAQAVFLMFTSSTRVWGQTLRISQHNQLYNHLIPSQCQVNTRCAEASTQWV